MPATPTTTARRTARREPEAEAPPAGSESLRAGIQSVEVGFELLNALSQASGALMLRDLAAAAGMSAAKAHRYLVSFQSMAMTRSISSSDGLVGATSRSPHATAVRNATRTSSALPAATRQ